MSTSNPPWLLEDLDQVDDDVDRDQHQGRRKRRAARCRPGWVADHAGALVHALRAAHADRRRGHAVGADRPPAGGAGDRRLAIRMPVTGLGHGSGSLQSRPMEPASPARLYATAAGALLILLGIVGFFYGSSFGSPWDPRPHPRRPPHQRLGQPAVGLSPGRSACCWRALPRAPTRLPPACSSPCSASGDWPSPQVPQSSAGHLPAAGANEALYLALGILGLLAAAGTPRRASSGPRLEPVPHPGGSKALQAARLLPPAPPQLEQHQRPGRHPAEPRPRPPAGPSCGGHEAPASRSRRAPRPSRIARSRRPPKVP